MSIANTTLVYLRSPFRRSPSPVRRCILTCYKPVNQRRAKSNFRQIHKTMKVEPRNHSINKRLCCYVYRCKRPALFRYSSAFNVTLSFPVLGLVCDGLVKGKTNKEGCKFSWVGRRWKRNGQSVYNRGQPGEISFLMTINDFVEHTSKLLWTWPWHAHLC